MYPRGEHKPDVCRECNGTGKVTDWDGIFEFDCDGCNGTGIAGSPGCALILCFLWFAIVVVSVLIWFR